MMKRNRRVQMMVAAVLLSVVLTAPGYAEDSPRDRGFMLQVGLGFASTQYTSELNALFRAAERMPGVTRTQINLHLGAGYAVHRNWYLSGLLDGVGDRLSDGRYAIQLNHYLFGVGVQGYPFGTGLVVGAHIGPARYLVDLDVLGTYTSDWGSGYNITLGYDFARRRTGVGFMAGLRIGGSNVEQVTMGYAALIGTVLFK